MSSWDMRWKNMLCLLGISSELLHDCDLTRLDFPENLSLIDVRLIYRIFHCSSTCRYICALEEAFLKSSWRIVLNVT